MSSIYLLLVISLYSLYSFYYIFQTFDMIYYFWSYICLKHFLSVKTIDTIIFYINLLKQQSANIELLIPEC